jgi:hypothetical protein
VGAAQGADAAGPKVPAALLDMVTSFLDD